MNYIYFLRLEPYSLFQSTCGSPKVIHRPSDVPAPILSGTVVTHFEKGNKGKKG
jgi:hypothetical protein